ncbi:MAG TPA: hypothetical protein VFG38_20745, partial [Pseudomonadales bacterium]|nr:hypothetical protein [Pseudomonadales bacterium]
MSSESAADSGVRYRFRVWLVFVTTLFVLFGLVVWPRLQVETDIVALLPTERNAEDVNRAVDQFSQALARRVIVLAGAPQLDAAKQAAHRIAATLRDSRAFARVELEVRGRTREQLDLYRAHRAVLLASRPYALLRDGAGETLLREGIRTAFTPTALTSPLGLAEDPLGLATAYLQQQVPAFGAAHLEGDVLVIDADSRHYVMIDAELAGSPFATETQEAASAAIDAARVQAGDGAQMLISGAVQHASAIADRAQRELTVFGTIETAAVMVLLIAVFGALRPLALGAMTTGVAFVAGMTANQLLFAKVHILALVFGSSLIGGVIDYSIHFFADRFRNPQRWTAADAYEHVGGAIALGLVTTLLGYVVLLLMPFPGLRQIATFCIAGLVAGCSTVLYGYPVLYRAPTRTAAFAPRFGAALTRRFAAWRWGGAAAFGAAALAAFTVLGVARIELRDDVTALQASPPALLDAERSVATLLHSAIESRYFLVSGNDAQRVLENEERLTRTLDPLVADGRLGAYTAVTRTLPSFARQRENRALLQRDVFGPTGLQARAWTQLGLDADAIARRVAAISIDTPLLTPEEWLTSPASEPYRLLWLHHDATPYASIVTLGGIKDVDALRAVAHDLDGVRLIDRIATITDVLRSYRVAIGWLLVAVYLVAGAVLSRRFGLREVPSLLAPSAAASLVTLGLFGWLGVPVNLFTLLS